MEYRKLGKTGMTVSAVSLGCEHLQGKSRETVRAVIDAALDAGINYMDVFMSEPNVRTDIGLALAGRRDKVMIQGHLGSCWSDGQYRVSRNMDECRAHFRDLLDRLGTDYVDVGMLHFVDKETDWRSPETIELLNYAGQLKEQGVIRAIGMSSHNPRTAIEAVKSGQIDVLMFSLNPAYDLVPKERDLTEVFDEVLKGKEQDFSGLSPEPVRAELYRLCEERGVAITVMKTLAMGTLLDARRSPLGVALTEAQCINYALSRPAVACVMVGMQRLSDVAAAAAYFDLPLEERDYSGVLGSLSMFSGKAGCMYCNHCLPCPAKIDIAAVNKYFDLVTPGTKPADSVRDHYLSLSHTAGACLGCGACESRCPFSVPVRERMKEAKRLFGA